MTFQFSPLAVLFVVSAIITTGVVTYAVLHGRRNGFDKITVTFIGVVLGVTIWTVARLLQMAVVDPWHKRFFIVVLYVGWGLSAVSLPSFAVSFTGSDGIVIKRGVILLSIVPVLGTLLAATNWYHEFLWTAHLETGNGLLYLDREFNPGFLVVLLHHHGAMLYGWYKLVRMAIGSRELYRGQVVAFVIGSVTPVIMGTLYAVDAYPGVPSYIDLTPVGFAVLGVTYAFAIYRYRLLDLVPIARKTVVESMRDGYIVLDTDRIVDFNNAAEEILQQDDQIIGKQMGDVLPQLDGIVDAHEHGTTVEEELSVQTATEQRFLVANCSSLYDDEETPLGRLLTLRDITDRRAVQKRYQALIENSSDLILVLDPDSTITYASPSIANITGVTPEQITGANTLDLVHEDDREGLEKQFERVLEDPDEPLRYEYRTRDTDGNWLVMEGVMRNMLDNPYVAGLVVNARDITDRKERERELERTNEQLEQFASVVSHDLRNPLNVARGHLQLAVETDDDEPMYEIEASLDRMEAIIEDMLTLARQGQSIGETEPVTLGEQAWKAWEHVATDEATLIIDEDVTFQADPDRLLQLLENLFRNAHEHVGPDVTVTVGSEGESFSVEDDGPGIPEDQCDEVLESGYTTNEDGTGFGLAIVSQIAEAHGWEVVVTEGSAGGARFEFHGIAQPLPAE